jgi:hypothetical protein
MILDNEMVFSDGQAITVDAISENVYDNGPLFNDANQSNLGLPDLSIGLRWYLWFGVGSVDFDSGGAGTLDITVRSDSTADLATSPTTHLVIPQIAETTLVAGYSFVAVCDVGTGWERYWGIHYNENDAASFTAGTITCFATPNVDRFIAFASGMKFRGESP